jgi:asparagine synthase (glutamine-hydrolysing)
MCGISGFVDFSQKPNKVKIEWIQSMNNALAHRGPDDEGYVSFNETTLQASSYFGAQTISFSSALPFAPTIPIQSAPEQNQSVFFAHRRLAIRELSEKGHQPMCNAQKNIWLVYNGEIFNSPELKQELVQKGYTFSGNSDTEVLLVAYQAWGTEMLSKLNGFFAFVICDTEKKILFGARDYNAVKPFYYVQNPAYFGFASEPKAFIGNILPDRNIQEAPIFDYLVNSKISCDTQHFYGQVKELEAGTMFQLDLLSGALVLNKYASQATLENQSIVTAESLLHQLQASVSSRLVSDVPIGFAYSGGIDSSILVHLAAKEQPNTILQLFSANSGVSSYDEGNWQKIGIQNLNVKHHIQQINPTEFQSQLSLLQHCNDSPLLGYNNLAHVQLLEKVRSQGVKVLFNGQGADELFAGYGTYYYSFFAESSLAQKISLFTHLHNAPVSAIELKKWIIRQLGIQSLPDFMIWQLAKFSKKWLKYIRPEFLELYQNRSLALESYPNNLNEALFKDYYGQRLREMLQWEDRSSMWFGIESRNPFADDKNLAKLAFSIPSNQKIHNGWSKYILRKSVENLIPKEIAWRKDKKGYSMPDIAWNQSQEPYLKSLCLDTNNPFIVQSKLEKDWDKLMQNQDLQTHKFLFRVANLSLFLQNK